ncbi:hypothetical protein [Nocardioides sp. W7]|uniref:hypothetical protein n=1 Tax=Nocardioides sp. W7 TaxID=2931390 RepID=UPI001FD172A2|nr:hypothetical protein [Nocardioides sp. W7]
MSDSRPPRPAEQVLQAGATAAWIAVPDYTSRPMARRTARAAVLAASAGAFVLLERRAPEEEDADEPNETEEPRPALVAAAVAAGLLASVGASVGGRRASRAAVERLRARGVRRPWTVVGLGTAAVTLALSAVQDRLQRSLPTTR